MLTETVICQKEPMQWQLSCHQLSKPLYPQHILLTTAWVTCPSCTEHMKNDKHVTTESKASHLTKPHKYKSV